MRKSLLSLPIIAALVAAPMTASADSGWFYISDTNNLFDSGILKIQYGGKKRVIQRHSHARIHDRLDHQASRIKSGMKTGVLTHKEKKRLKRQHRQITKLERRYLSDGHLSRAESRNLNDRLNTANKRIYRMKHNGQNRNTRHQH